MRYLLDTHVLLWWLNDPSKLAPKAKHIIENEDHEVLVSSVSIWEMAIKKELGKLSIPSNILSIISAEKFQILSLSAEESLGVLDLPNLHNDPFDRILIVQAKLNDLVFITSDQKILQYPLVCINA